MNYKIKYEDVNGVPCSIKIEERSIMDAINKAISIRKGTNFRGAPVYNEEDYLSI